MIHCSHYLNKLCTRDPWHEQLNIERILHRNLQHKQLIHEIVSNDEFIFTRCWPSKAHQSQVQQHQHQYHKFPLNKTIKQYPYHYQCSLSPSSSISSSSSLPSVIFGLFGLILIVFPTIDSSSSFLKNSIVPSFCHILSIRILNSAI